MARTGLEWYQYYLYDNKMNGILIIINMCCVGATIFPMVSVTLEELVMRLNPKYLVTVQLLCTIACQGFASLVTQGAGSYLKEKEQKRTRAMTVQFLFCIAYTILLICHFFTMAFQKKENRRNSYIQRLKFKNEIARRRKTMRLELSLIHI